MSHAALLHAADVSSTAPEGTTKNDRKRLTSMSLGAFKTPVPMSKVDRGSY